MQVSRTSTTLLAVAAITVGMAGAAQSVQVASSQDEWIPSLTAVYRGPESSAGRSPRILVVATHVTEAFVDLVSAKTVRAVAAATDGKAAARGDRVSVEGYSCRARAFKVREPGTAGEYFDVSWVCRMEAADTPTSVVLTYRQSSL